MVLYTTRGRHCATKHANLPNPREFFIVTCLLPLFALHDRRKASMDRDLIGVCWLTASLPTVPEAPKSGAQCAPTGTPATAYFGTPPAQKRAIHPGRQGFWHFTRLLSGEKPFSKPSFRTFPRADCPPGCGATKMWRWRGSAHGGMWLWRRQLPQVSQRQRHIPVEGDCPLAREGPALAQPARRRGGAAQIRSRKKWLSQPSAAVVAEVQHAAGRVGDVPQHAVRASEVIDWPVGAVIDGSNDMADHFDEPGHLREH